MQNLVDKFPRKESVGQTKVYVPIVCRLQEIDDSGSVALNSRQQYTQRNIVLEKLRVQIVSGSLLQSSQL